MIVCLYFEFIVKQATSYYMSLTFPEVELYNKQEKQWHDNMNWNMNLFIPPSKSLKYLSALLYYAAAIN